MKRLISFIIIITSGYIGFGQFNEANIWVFGRRAGLNFNFPDGPQPYLEVSDNFITQEGCASIANINGNLMFYTDGQSVWNKNHETMENGTGLNGDFSSTQSGIIVPKPNDPNIYYVFTVPYQGDPVGLNYSVIDISLNGGLGKVVQKNIQLEKGTPVTEKVTAMKHANNEDIWVVTHKWETYKVIGGDTAFFPSDTLLAYLVTENGVQTPPVISKAGSKVGGNSLNTVGYLKGSPSGDRLAMGVFHSDYYQLFDFDPYTGAVSNPITFTGFKRAYGIEFSPNSRYLYLSEEDDFDVLKMHIYQYDLLAGDSNAIKNSGLYIGFTTNNYFIGRGALQVGPDQKIYIARANLPYLAVINNPNLRGAACEFDPEGIWLGATSYRTSLYGLPTFIQTYFAPPTFDYDHICNGDSTEFWITSDITGYISILWSFGDGGTSNELNPKHQYPDAGNYVVTLEVTYQSTERTAEEVITILTKPTANFNYQPYCFGSPTQFNDLSVSNGGSITQWYWDFGDGNSTVKNPQHTFSTPGQHFVHLTVTTDNGCVSTVKTLPVNQIPPPSVSGTPTGPVEMCENSPNSSYQTIGAGDAVSYQWNISPSNAGIISGTGKNATVDWNNTFSGNASITVTSINQCNEAGPPSNPLQVTINALPSVYAGADQDILYNTSTTINDATVTGNGPFTIYWMPADSLLDHTVVKPTTVVLRTPNYFTMTVTDNNQCNEEDEVFIDIYGGPLGVTVHTAQDSICLGGQTQLVANAFGGSEEYEYDWTCNPNPDGWSSSLKSPTVSPDTTTTFTVTVFDGFNSRMASILITVVKPPVVNAGEDQTVAWGTPAQLDGSAHGGAGRYSWYWTPADSVNNPYIPKPETRPVLSPYSLYLRVTDYLGCESSDNVFVQFEGGPVSSSPIATPDTVCDGETTELVSNPAGGTGGYKNFLWQPDSLIVNPTSQNAVTKPLHETTTFTVYLEDGNGFPTGGQVTVTVNPLPEINLFPEAGSILNDSTVAVCVYDTIILRPYIGEQEVSYLWSNGSTDDTLQVQTTGIGFDIQTHGVRIEILETGCYDEEKVTIIFTYDECVGIDEPDKDTYMFTYPNPASGITNLVTKGMEGRFDLELQDMKGLVVRKGTLHLRPEHPQTHQIDLSGLHPGIYLVRLLNSNRLYINKVLIR